MIGRTVSHYRIVGQLGAGGMGVVYAAEDERLGRPVALKFLPEDLAKDSLAIDRLRGEARTASALNHPNICTIFDVGEYDNRPFIAMELIDGRTLLDRLVSGPLKVGEILDMGIQVADALDVAHQRDIIHRDIKPANLFLTPRGHVKVVDFGLAKLVAPERSEMTTAGVTREQTAKGTTLGTVSYMSPEQVTGDDLDGRTDLFSLGVVLYECVTGRQPFTGRTSAMIFSAILTQTPVAPVAFNPEIPLRLQEIINNCLEKDRELRCHDAAALRADLRRLKRDLESGRSGVFRLPGAPADAQPAASDAVSTASAPRSRVGKVLGIEAAIVAAALAIAGAIYLKPAPKVVDGPASTAGETAAPAKVETSAPRVEGLPRSTVEGPAPGNVAGTRGQTSPDATVGPTVETRRPQPEPAAQTNAARRDPQPAPPLPAPPEPPARDAGTDSRPPELQRPAAPSESTQAAAPPQETPAPIAAPVPVAPIGPAAPPAPRQGDTRVDHAERSDTAPAPRSAESDEAAIRRVIATYARAIEAKDISLFRSMKPNLSGEEQRRIEEGFRAVESQRVDVTVLSIDVRAQEASVRLRRRDTIQAGGRQQTTESQQTMTLIRTGSGWVIREIGR